MRNKIILFCALVGIVGGGLTFYFVKRHQVSRVNNAKYQSEATAMGVHDELTVQRPLSATQTKRLEKHFLRVPETFPGSFNASEHTAPTVVDQVNRINAMNRSQSERK